MQTLIDTWSGFSFMPAAEFADDTRAVPERPGLYLLCFSESGGLPARARAAAGRSVGGDHEYSMLYVGQSCCDVRVRLTCHLLNTAWVSCLRKTAGLLMRDPLDLEPQPGFGGGRNWAFGYEGEARLTDWLLSDAVIGFRITHDPIGEERELIERMAPILNIEGRRRTEEGRRLISLLKSARPPLVKRPMNRISRPRSAHFP